MWEESVAQCKLRVGERAGYTRVFSRIIFFSGWQVTDIICKQIQIQILNRVKLKTNVAKPTSQ